MQESLLGLVNNYFEISKNEAFQNNKIIDAHFDKMVNDVKILLVENNLDWFKCDYSYGKGSWAIVPWFAILNPKLTTSVSEGIYVVYLFSASEKCVYLTINQGTGGINKASVGSEQKVNSKMFLDQISKYSGQFNKGTLPNKSLDNESRTRPKAYEQACILWKKYDLKTLNEIDENLVINDLKELLNIYSGFLSASGEEDDNNIKFDTNIFVDHVQNAGLIYNQNYLTRLIGSLMSKPFLILTGLSGSGKTKIAQAFVQWICENASQYLMIPVGADWTNREPLLGYPNGLNANEYITPDSGVINLLLEALKVENNGKPFFLILDEMNLSHVERYFADFLSIMESNDTIKLYTGNERYSLDGLKIPFKIGWPKNLFIIGTVNIDETTYMFSPKVLDRANVIEFRITDDEIQFYLNEPRIPKLENLQSKGIAMAEIFLKISEKNEIVKNEFLSNELVLFFNQLKNVGAEFGYRSATEILLLVSKLKMIDSSLQDKDCLDIAIMQKLLPKLHGSRSKLVKILIALAGLCVDGMKKEDFEKNFEELYKKEFEAINVKYSISFEKLIRMYKNVLANGFTSYAEA